MATDNTGADYFGDRVKCSTVKSSTMKGAIEYVRERLPVRLCESFVWEYVIVLRTNLTPPYGVVD